MNPSLSGHHLPVEVIASLLSGCHWHVTKPVCHTKGNLRLRPASMGLCGSIHKRHPIYIRNMHPPSTWCTSTPSLASGDLSQFGIIDGPNLNNLNFIVFVAPNDISLTSHKPSYSLPFQQHVFRQNTGSHFIF